MNVLRPLTFAIVLGCLPVLGACSANTDSSSSSGIAASVDSSISSALDKVQAKLKNEPITVSHNTPNLPVAKITPQGDFIVDGKTIAVTAAQREALLEYRKQMIAIASQGIAVGKQGAALGLQAASTAIADALSGKSDAEIHQKVEAQTAGIRQAAAKICEQLPSMLTGQQKLAAALPAFKPYATMTQKDIDHCRYDALHDDDDDADRAQVRESIRERIRGSVRSGIQASAQSAGIAASGTSSGGAPAATSSVTQH